MYGPKTESITVNTPLCPLLVRILFSINLRQFGLEKYI